MFPPVIKNLLIINGVMFFLQLLGESVSAGNGFTFSDKITQYFGLIPVNGFVAARGMGGVIVWDFLPWQLITYQFLHGSFSHIFFNMFMLWMFGMEIENLWGSKKFLYYYLLCGVAAGLSQLFIAPLFTTPAPTIGASGAIFGVMIAFGMIFPDRYIFLWFLIPIKAKYLIGFLFIIEFLLIRDTGSNVAHLAHLGGAVAGFIFIMLDKNTYVPFKNIFRNYSSGRGSSSINNPFGGIKDKFTKQRNDVEEANYYDINNKKESRDVSQEELDRILDKISQSGYQNLTDEEKKILFDASNRMNKS